MELFKSTCSTSSQDRTNLQTYKAVVFLLVEDSYYVEDAITCRYGIQEENLIPKEGDQIVLFRILSYGQKPIATAAVENSKCLISGREYEIHILVEKVTKDDLEDLYQFRYVTAEDIVIGASLPFRLKSRNIVDESLLLTADDDDTENFTVVSSRTEFVHDRIRTVFQQNLNLLEENRSVRAELNEKVKEMETKSAEFEQKMKDSNAAFGKLQEDYDNLKKEFETKVICNEQLTRFVIPRMEEQIENLEEEATKRAKELREKGAETEVLRQRLIYEEVQHKSKIKELEDSCKRRDMDLVEMASLKNQWANKFAETSMMLDLSKDRKRHYKTEQSRLFEELKNSEDMISALKSSKELALQEVKAHKECCEEALKDSMESREDVSRLNELLKQANEEIANLRQMLDEERRQVEELRRDKGSEAETQTVECEEEIEKMKSDYEEKIRDLIERLDSAKSEYERIYVKNELKKKKIEKITEKVRAQMIRIESKGTGDRANGKSTDVAQS